jgi:hypothetical protein
LPPDAVDLPNGLPIQRDCRVFGGYRNHDVVHRNEPSLKLTPSELLNSHRGASFERFHGIPIVR